MTDGHTMAASPPAAAGDPVTAVDLFCGAGGLSAGLALACEALDRPVNLVAVNHWETAIESHERNHPWADHYHTKVEATEPRAVVDDPDDVQIVTGGPECTHYSSARGGKPVDEQKRASPWHVLDWVAKLQPEHVLIENVPEFESWGPVINGQPTRNGQFFDAWVETLQGLGYQVGWRTLNAADYGDATSRTRLFIIASKAAQPRWPAPTHDDWRPASEIIDWSERGQSIWTRGLEDNGKQPLVANTMQRIAEGLRRHGSAGLEAFADAISNLDRGAVDAMQERIVPAEYAALVADVLDDPFLVAPPAGAGSQAAVAAPHLVKYYGTSTTRPVTQPVDTITAGGQKYGLATPYILGQHTGSQPRSVAERPVPTITTTSRGIALARPSAFVLGQHSGSRPRAVDDQPVPTIATGGAISVVDPAPFVLPRNGYHRGLHSNPAYDPRGRPLHTVTAKNHDGWIVSPSLIRFSHGGKMLDVTDPLPTITTARGGVFALASPYLVPFYGERPGQRPRTRSIDVPYPVVTATGSQHGLASPYLIQYHGQSTSRPVTDPLPTVTTRDSLALCLPDHYPWGLDVRFRMLQPRELAAAMGFPPGYEFAGTKTETIEQIGNAVPVNLAKALCQHLLGGGGDPTLGAFDTAEGDD